jgi:hypothetical protein
MIHKDIISNNDRNNDMTVVVFEYDGILTQSIILNSMDIVENNIEHLGTRGIVSTIVIELTQNMMKYSKSNNIHCRDIRPAGFIEVKKDKDDNYYIQSKNILSIEDKQKIEPIIKHIQQSDLKEIKTRYKELRRSGENTHAKGGGIGFYEVAKLVSNIEYNFKTINEDKFEFEYKVVVKSAGLKFKNICHQKDFV